MMERLFPLGVVGQRQTPWGQQHADFSSSDAIVVAGTRDEREVTPIEVERLKIKLRGK